MYYYFAASLPMLEFEGKLPMTVAFFGEECQRLLTKRDFSLMKDLLCDDEMPQESRNSVYNAWIRFNHNFRNELAWFRAQRLHKDPSSYIRGQKENEPSLVEMIHQASKHTNFLEAEKLLAKAKWQFLNELESSHYHDLEFLFVYGLKLKILEKFQEYSSPEGKQTLFEYRTMEFPESCILDAN